MKNQLKVWLQKNELTTDPNDFTASVSTPGSATFDDIINEIVSEGTEHSRETLADISRRFQRASSRLVLNGYNVNTGQVYMRPVITGAFYDKKWNAEKNSIYVSITQGVDLRKEVADTSVEILGEKADLMTIFRVTNLVTKQADGTLTRGRNAQIDGTYIKVAGEFPGAGIWLENLDTQAQTRIEAENIIVNEPSKVLILVPDTLPAGLYRLRIITQYSPKKDAKKIRESVYEQTLTVS